MIDLVTLRDALAAHGRVARIVVVQTAGSTPREVGAAMLVWQEAGGHLGHSGTIGGGALEWQAITKAATLLTNGKSVLTRHPLGPELGQCCGGSVTLASEVFTKGTLADLTPETVYARSISLDLEKVAPQDHTPLGVARLMAKARNQGQRDTLTLCDDWLIEPCSDVKQPLWIWGAGHVGRALVDVIGPLRDFEITWVDVASDRFPPDIPPNVSPLWTQDTAALTVHVPSHADHLVLTYSHALDLELCHRLLTRGFASLGLIGSKTKWVRFSKRLGQLGHAVAALGTITCPIGDPLLGKEPHAIALGVATALLKQNALRKQACLPLRKCLA